MCCEREKRIAARPRAKSKRLDGTAARGPADSQWRRAQDTFRSNPHDVQNLGRKPCLYTELSVRGEAC